MRSSPLRQGAQSPAGDRVLDRLFWYNLTEMENICQNCGQMPATLHYTVSGPDGQQEVHLCEKCLAELSKIESSLKDLSNRDITESKVLAAAAELVLKLINLRNSAEIKTSDSIVCPRCRMSIRDFKSGGGLGCPQCYHSFSTDLEMIIPSIHEGGKIHRGKSPKPTDRKLRRCLELERRLSQAIASEDYETAARLRDELAETKKKTN